MTPVMMLLTPLIAPDTMEPMRFQTFCRMFLMPSHTPDQSPLMRAVTVSSTDWTRESPFSTIGASASMMPDIVSLKTGQNSSQRVPMRSRATPITAETASMPELTVSMVVAMMGDSSS